MHLSQPRLGEIRVHRTDKPPLLLGRSIEKRDDTLLRMKVHFMQEFVKVKLVQPADLFDALALDTSRRIDNFKMRCRIMTGKFLPDKIFRRRKSKAVT